MRSSLQETYPQRDHSSAQSLLMVSMSAAARSAFHDPGPCGSYPACGTDLPVHAPGDPMLIERELELYGQSTDGSDLAGAEVLVPNDGDATCIDSRLQVGLPAQAQSLDGIGVGDSQPVLGRPRELRRVVDALATLGSECRADEVPGIDNHGDHLRGGGAGSELGENRGEARHLDCIEQLQSRVVTDGRVPPVDGLVGIPRPGLTRSFPEEADARNVHEQEVGHGGRARVLCAHQQVPEPVEPGETHRHAMDWPSTSFGWLIQAGPGSLGGVGGLLTNRSGWAT